MNTGVEIGATLVGYRVETLLGRGGMGFVYRAEHLALGRKVALKVLAPELTDNKEFRSRFMLESRTAARLEHPNIIPIYEPEKPTAGCTSRCGTSPATISAP